MIIKNKKKERFWFKNWSKDGDRDISLKSSWLFTFLLQNTQKQASPKNDLIHQQESTLM